MLAAAVGRQHATAVPFQTAGGVQEHGHVTGGMVQAVPSHTAGGVHVGGGAVPQSNACRRTAVDFRMARGASAHNGLPASRRWSA